MRKLVLGVWIEGCGGLTCTDVWMKVSPLPPSRGGSMVGLNVLCHALGKLCGMRKFGCLASVSFTKWNDEIFTL